MGAGSEGAASEGGSEGGDPQRGELNPVAMVRWFSRRAGSVRKLTLSGDSLRLPPGLVGTFLGTQATSLRELCLDSTAAPLSGSELLVLAALTALEKLTISLQDDFDVPGPQRGDNGTLTIECMAQVIYVGSLPKTSV